MMKIAANTPEEYIAQLAEDRQSALAKLRSVILQNIPEGFKETMNYGMIGYVVPHTLYPAGYHVNPKLPLPFINIASQKGFVAFYHLGIYADPDLLAWFTNEYRNHTSTKLDMGKSCIRFKKIDQIPYELLGQLSRKMSAQQWINLYESNKK